MNYIDLFAGAGGLSEGFINNGFKPIAHVEMDRAACFSIKTRVARHYLKSAGKYDRYLSYLKGEISRSELYSSIPLIELESVINLQIGEENNEQIHSIIERRLQGNPVDLIIGGPPCQAYSLVGRARSADGMQNDPRNHLYIEYAAYLDKYQPTMFVFENVLGLKSAKKGFYLESMERLFYKIGYKMRLFTVEANNFGVLQNRKRVVIIGWKKDIQLEIPDLEAIDKSGQHVVQDLLSDLPSLKAGSGIDKYTNYISIATEYLKDAGIRNGINVLTQHVARPHTEQDKKIYHIAVNKWKNSKERLNYNDLPDYLKTHNNRTSFHDRFKVVAPDLKYSQTVVAHIAKDGHYYIHPDIMQNRSITVREAARLQSFPDDYYFEGIKEGASRTAAFKQIGNAVPPLMASIIASQLKNKLLSDQLVL